MMKLVGAGRFVADPELKEASGSVVCEFTLVYNEYRRVGNEKVRTPHFLQFSAWDSGGSTIAEQCRKGDTLIFSAKPRQKRWEKDGKKLSRVVFRVEEFQVLKRDNDQEETNPDD